MSRYRSLEAFKFAVYLLVPISLVGAIVYSPDNLDAVIRNRSYVIYPPEGPRPPSPEEFAEASKKQRGL